MRQQLLFGAGIFYLMIFFMIFSVKKNTTTSKNEIVYLIPTNYTTNDFYTIENQDSTFTFCEYSKNQRLVRDYFTNLKFDNYINVFISSLNDLCFSMSLNNNNKKYNYENKFNHENNNITDVYNYIERHQTSIWYSEECKDFRNIVGNNIYFSDELTILHYLKCYKVISMPKIFGIIRIENRETNGLFYKNNNILIHQIDILTMKEYSLDYL
jgi:hypothetical protein